MATQTREEVADEVLMMRFQGGDQSAFAGLVRRHKTPVYNFILRTVRSREVAEDLVQDVFVKVVQNAADFKHEARFSTWAYTIARNVCIDHLRKAALRRHPSLDQAANNNAGEDGPTLGDRIADAHFAASADRMAIGAELGQRITRAVEDLPPEQREVFLLREVGHVPFKEIAEIVGVPENTTKSRMRYALERLQQALAEYEDYARALR
ncbi:MAG TPA: RNA polymerase sigma factor [Polyangium sp.]|jgi:RNA polymerase sigma-70 factor (ECF subfamily)|nr:RNA polymerase sigma factor [Polyangium sp.]